MSNFAMPVRRQLLAELRLLHYSRAWIISFPLLLAAAAAYAGSRSSVRTRADDFEGLLTQYRANGVSMGDVLAAPTSVTVHEDGSETIDNPLKHDFLELSELIAATDPVHMPATALDLTTYLVIPLAFLFLGAWMANVDRATGAIDWRAARQSWASVACAKFIAIAVIAVLAVVTTGLAGLAIGSVGELLIGPAKAELPIPAATETPRPLLVKSAVSALFATLWGLVGYLIGYLTRSFSWPVVLAALFLFLVPFLGKWDPRNAQAALGHHVYDFWGQFKVRSAIPTSESELVISFAIVGVLIALGLVRAARHPRLT